MSGLDEYDEATHLRVERELIDTLLYAFSLKAQGTTGAVTVALLNALIRDARIEGETKKRGVIEFRAPGRIIDMLRMKPIAEQNPLLLVEISRTVAERKNMPVQIVAPGIPRIQ